MNNAFKTWGVGILTGMLMVPSIQRVALGALTWAQADSNVVLCKRQVNKAKRECRDRVRAAVVASKERRAGYRACTARGKNELQICRKRAEIRAGSETSLLRLAQGTVAAETSNPSSPMITTDRLDYKPFDVVTIAGVGWSPGESVSIVLTVDPATHDSVTVSSVADDTGGFLNTDYVVQLADLGVTFTATAAGADSGAVAQTVFADAVAIGALAAPSPCSFSPCKYNDTHWRAQAGTTVVGTITGATDVSARDQMHCAAGEVEVIVHSSDFGNTTLCGTLSGTTITFSWDVPAGGCNTSIISYGHSAGNIANNSLILGGDGRSAAGFAIVDADGNVIDTCAPATPTPTASPGASPPQITACKYQDDDADGEKDGTEAWLSGWAISIDPAPSGQDATLETDESGCVTWTDLEPGVEYTISETATAGGNPWFNTDPGNGGPCLIDPSGCANPSKTVVGPSPGETSTVLFGNVQSAKVRVCKYEDLNLNGRNDDEPPLADWTMAVAGMTSGTQLTDESGCASFFVVPVGTYAATELLKLGPPKWINSDPGQNGAPCDAALCPIPSKSELVVSANEETVVFFGNLQLAEKRGQKFYDLNTNGANDDGQVVAGILITLTGTDLLGSPVSRSAYTDALGRYTFTDLLPSCSAPPCSSGYTVTERKPNSTWVNTTPMSITFGLDPGEVEVNNDFGNVCLGAGGGLTIGFWSNKNGQSKMESMPMASALGTLQALNLRSTYGANFDPTTYAQYRNWLLNASATNMAYMLSAQLSGMAMNVKAGFVPLASLVYAGSAPASCSVPGLSGNGFISIMNLMSAADAASNFSLASYGNTTPAGAARSCQEFMKIALDRANNNLNFVQPQPCRF